MLLTRTKHFPCFTVLAFVLPEHAYNYPEKRQSTYPTITHWSHLADTLTTTESIRYSTHATQSHASSHLISLGKIACRQNAVQVSGWAVRPILTAMVRRVTTGWESGDGPPSGARRGPA